MDKLKSAFKSGTAWKYLFFAMVMYGLALGIFRGCSENYFADIVLMDEFDRGVLEFFRELPGLLLVLILAIFYTTSAETFFKVGLLIMLFGMGAMSVIPTSKILVIMAVCIQSTGEHIQMGMKNTLTLNYSKPEKSGLALGYLGSMQQLGTVIGYLVIVAAFSFWNSEETYRIFFLIGAIFLAFASASAFKMKGNVEAPKEQSRFYFNKKYRKYYMLEVFYGARKQVFLTFGPYVLILFYGASAATISLLFAISGVVCFFLSPVVGRIIDAVGYKIVMIMDTIILVVVCFFYGFAHHFFPMDVAFIICCVNYVLDSVISMASMATNVYVKDISDNPDELKATLATGLSVNHAITVLIALFGGWVWQTLGIETLFVLSAVLGLCNSAYAATIKVPKKGAVSAARAAGGAGAVDAADAADAAGKSENAQE